MQWKLLWSLALLLPAPCLPVTLPLMHIATDLFALSCNNAHCKSNCFILECQHFEIAYVCKFSSCRAINYWILINTATTCHENRCCASKTLLQCVFNIGCWIRKTSKFVDASAQGMGKSTWWSSMILNPELAVAVSLQCWQWTECFNKLSLNLSYLCH